MKTRVLSMFLSLVLLMSAIPANLTYASEIPDFTEDMQILDAAEIVSDETASQTIEPEGVPEAQSVSEDVDISIEGIEIVGEELPEEMISAMSEGETAAVLNSLEIYDNGYQSIDLTAGQPSYTLLKSETSTMVRAIYPEGYTAKAVYTDSTGTESEVSLINNGWSKLENLPYGTWNLTITVANPEVAEDSKVYTVSMTNPESEREKDNTLYDGGIRVEYGNSWPASTATVYQADENGTASTSTEIKNDYKYYYAELPYGTSQFKLTASPNGTNARVRYCVNGGEWQQWGSWTAPALDAPAKVQFQIMDEASYYENGQSFDGAEEGTLNEFTVWVKTRELITLEIYDNGYQSIDLTAAQPSYTLNKSETSTMVRAIYPEGYTAKAVYTDSIGSPAEVSLINNGWSNLGNLPYGTWELTITVADGAAQTVGGYTVSMTNTEPEREKDDTLYENGIQAEYGAYPNIGTASVYQADENGNITANTQVFNDYKYYYAELPEGTEQFRFTASPNGTNAKVRYSVNDGEWQTWGMWTAPSFNTPAKIRFQIISEENYYAAPEGFDGKTTNDFTVWVHTEKEAEVPAPKLSNLEFYAGNMTEGLNQAFSPDVYDGYTAELKSSETSLPIKVTFDANSTVEAVYGTEDLAQTMELESGSWFYLNSFPYSRVNEDGVPVVLTVTDKTTGLFSTYTLQITHLEPERETDKTLYYGGIRVEYGSGWPAPTASVYQADENGKATENTEIVNSHKYYFAQLPADVTQFKLTASPNGTNAKVRYCVNGEEWKQWGTWTAPVLEAPAVVNIQILDERAYYANNQSFDGAETNDFTVWIETKKEEEAKLNSLEIYDNGYQTIDLTAETPSYTLSKSETSTMVRAIFDEISTASASYTNSSNEQTDIDLINNGWTNLGNLPYGTWNLTITVAGADSEENAETYVVSITNPEPVRSEDKSLYEGGIRVEYGSGWPASTATVYQVQGNGSSTNTNIVDDCKFYFAELPEGVEQFKFTASPNGTNAKVRYSTDNGKSWQEWGTWTAPELNTPAKVKFQILDEKTYFENGNSFDGAETNDFTVWVRTTGVELETPKLSGLEFYAGNMTKGLSPEFAADTFTGYAAELKAAETSLPLKVSFAANYTANAVYGAEGSEQTVTLHSGSWSYLNDFPYSKAEETEETADETGADNAAASTGVPVTITVKDGSSLTGKTTTYTLSIVHKEPERSEDKTLYEGGNGIRVEYGSGWPLPTAKLYQADENGAILQGEGKYSETVEDKHKYYAAKIPADYSQFKLTVSPNGTNAKVRYSVNDGAWQEWGTWSAPALDTPAKVDFQILDEKAYYANGQSFGEAPETNDFTVWVDTENKVEAAQQLASLSFASSAAEFDTTAYTLSSEFKPIKSHYLIYVPSDQNTMAVKAVLPETSEGKTVTVEYTDVTGEAKVIPVTSGTATELPGLIKENDLSVSAADTPTLIVKVSDVTAAADGEDQTSAYYSFHVTRQPIASGLTITDQNSKELALTPEFDGRQYKYSAMTAADGDFFVTVEAPSGDNAGIYVNGSQAKPGVPCKVTPKWNADKTAELYITLSNTAAPSVTYKVTLEQESTELKVTKTPTKTSYKAGETFDPAGMEITAVFADASTRTLSAEEYVITPTGELRDEKEITVTWRGKSVTQSITVSMISGTGTKEDPFLLTSVQDAEIFRDLVNKGESYKGQYVQLAEDITLPEDWTPVGSISKAFQGTFLGADHLITVAEGGKTFFGNLENGAKIQKLNIYGKKIAGFGVVDNYTTGQSFTLESITLKSGTQTLKSGFVGGYGNESVTIRNSKVEAGVVIGYDKNQSNIGSFGGDFNGVIENCTSSAAVYGVNFVGGIAGSKGQSTREYRIENCTFSGTVEASGKYAGGISGGGYGGTWLGIASAPNTFMANIVDCTVTGTVKGNEYVGGILGAEPGLVQCWENGIGYIENNIFTGRISGNTYVGAIIGYMHSLNKYTNIRDNSYSPNCGAKAGIGGAAYVDTSSGSKTQLDSGTTTYFNTANGKPGISGVARTDHNRTDDPLGKDAHDLAAPTNAIAVSFTLLGDSQHGEQDQIHTMNDGNLETWLTGSTYLVSKNATVQEVFEEALTANGLTWENPSGNYITSITKGDITLSEKDNGPDSGWMYTLNGTYPEYGVSEQKVANGDVLVFHYTDNYKWENPQTVTFTLLGDRVHGEDGTVHTLKDGNLETWIVESSYDVPEYSTVKDLFEKALNENGMLWENEAGNYVTSITNDDVTLAAFDNGNNSGWMYTLNGKQPDLGIDQQMIAEGDAVVFHYSDDYCKEEHPHYWGSGSVTKAATCQTTGIMTYTCWCGISKTEEIPLAAHVWDAGKVTRAATCKETGIKTYTCQSGGETRTETIAKSNVHTFGEWKQKTPASISAAEVQERACTVCGNPETRSYGSVLKGKIKVPATSLKMKKGQKFTKFAVTGLVNGDGVQSWKSSNTKIVKVTGKADGSCVLQAQKKTGTAYITITLKSKVTQKIKVTVQSSTVKTTKITGVKSKATIQKGKTFTLKPVLAPITSQQKVTFKS